MKRFKWPIVLGSFLIALSIVLYLAHYTIFRDTHHIFIYMLGDIAFLPIEVLLVVLIIHRLLSEREKRTRLEKMSMVIGAFFTEVGTQLLTYLSDFDPKLDKIRKDLIVTDDWSEREFFSVSNRLKTYHYEIKIRLADLEDLRHFLLKNRDFLLRLLENPALLERESFTRLLRAVFHVAEELTYRRRFKTLPATDYEHLTGDVKRIYTLLIYEWLDYMKYLKDNYPYLFSLAMRTNPFDQKATPIVK
ncbi:hypothetical protein KAT51_04050 [bacterium]|nr:hypothetical protein [bacterium]